MSESTTNYDMFKRLKGNRPLVEKHVLEIVKSIEENGNLTPTIPIQANKEFEILDGQHRLEACKRLGMPVNYEVIDNVTLSEVRAINLRRRNWTWQDYGYSFASEGKNSYKLFMDLWEEFGYPLAILLQATNNSDHQHSFRSGKLEIGNVDVARQKLSYLRECIDALDGSVRPTRSFMAAALNLFNSPQYKQTRMIDKLKNYGDRLQEWATVADFMRNIEDIYNFRQSEKGLVRLY